MKYLKTALTITLSVAVGSIPAALPAYSQVDVPTVVTKGYNGFVEQDEAKEQQDIKDATYRIRMEKKRDEAEQVRQEIVRVATEQEAIRIAAEKKASRVESERLRVEEEERLRQEAEVMPTIPASPVTSGSGQDWINETMAIYGVYPPAGTTFLVTDEGNCGGPGGGCTDGLLNRDKNSFLGPYLIRLSPTAIGVPHILFHEIGHTHGIIDECQAEAFAKNVTNDYMVYSSNYARCL